jgi:hypothetical protein
VTSVIDHPRKIAFGDLPSRHRDFKTLGNVGLFHEAEAQLDACDAIGDRSDHDSIFV